MKILFADGYNLLYRARFGFGGGEFNTVYTFFRSLKSLVEKMEADKLIVVLEGHPKFRYDLYPEYKANRKVARLEPKKVEEYSNFKRQKDIVISILSRMPLELLVHPDYEGDDLIGKLVTSVYKDDECVVITSDTDFLQLFSQSDNVSIYDPVKKSWFDKPDYDYILWKSMVGDKSDNIVGVRGIGKKTAPKILLKSSEEFSAWMNEKPEKRLKIIERNKTLIRFADVPLSGVNNLSEEPDMDFVKSEFERMEFKTMIKDSYWSKFANVFEY